MDDLNFKTAKEMYQIYKNVKIDINSINEVVKELLLELENKVKRGDDIKASLCYANMGKKKRDCIADTLINLGYEVELSIKGGTSEIFVSIPPYECYEANDLTTIIK